MFLLTPLIPISWPFQTVGLGRIFLNSWGCAAGGFGGIVPRASTAVTVAAGLGRRPGMAQAKYQEIADRLRDQIDGGLLQPGERLPSEPDLVKTFDASRNTVRLAI